MDIELLAQSPRHTASVGWALGTIREQLAAYWQFEHFHIPPNIKQTIVEAASILAKYRRLKV